MLSKNGSQFRDLNIRIIFKTSTVSTLVVMIRNSNVIFHIIHLKFKDIFLNYREFKFRIFKSLPIK